MAGTNNTEFTLGEQYWCVASMLSTPLLGTIIGLTDAPGKRIGLQFDESIPGGHTCDMRGNVGYCLWTIPEEIYDTTEWETVNLELTTQIEKLHVMRGKDYKRITIDEDGRVVGGQDESLVGLHKVEGNLAPAVKG